MNKKNILIAFVFIVLHGCASRPESISPSYVSHERYQNTECENLTIEKNKAINELVKYSDLQNNDANNDAVGVFLLGVPFSQLSGDHKADVAKWKGTIDAIETAQIISKCDYVVYIKTKKKIVTPSLQDDAL
jgi:type IV pilus biogenesis protein CpaD/CtpE